MALIYWGWMSWRWYVGKRIVMLCVVCWMSMESISLFRLGGVYSAKKQATWRFQDHQLSSARCNNLFSPTSLAKCSRKPFKGQNGHVHDVSSTPNVEIDPQSLSPPRYYPPLLTAPKTSPLRTSQPVLEPMTKPWNASSIPPIFGKTSVLRKIQQQAKERDCSWINILPNLKDLVDMPKQHWRDVKLL